MTPERWKQVREVLETALDVSSKERAALLDDVCVDDPALRREVEELLAAYEEDFLEHTPLDGIKQQLGEKPSLEGHFIGPYKIIREIGQGGMGAVFLAMRADDQYKKRVAIKLVKRGMDTDYVLGRFRHERQILASLDHPNIARFLDGGATEDGLPYFVMEYIEGQPIDKYCDENRLTTVERLKLFQTVCSAVHYAHQNLIVHRDLKPGNIIVTAEGTPKLMDFGIAKLLNPNLYAQTLVPTALSQRLLTPDYASPEQVRGKGITTASDVYSLGVLLYELLTGHRPYQFKSYTSQEIERVICEEQPEKPSTAINRVETGATSDGKTEVMITPELVSRTREGQPDKLKKKLAGDLDNIVLMAMRKEPLRRYLSVEQFSEDIRRHLEGLPCIARKDTFAYRTGKFVRRNKIAVAVATAFVILTIVSAVLVINQSIRAARERDKARQVSAFLIELFKVSDPNEARGNAITAREILDKGAERIERELADQPEVQATLMNTMGEVYNTLGLYDSAIHFYEKALKIRRNLFGNEHASVAESLNDLGVATLNKANYEAAEPMLRETLAIRRKLFGKEHIDVAETMVALASLLVNTGKYDEAESLYYEALPMERKLWGNEHEEVATTLNDLALLLYQRGKYEETELLFREANAIYRKVFGDESRYVAMTLSNLGALLRNQGKFADAITNYREAIALNRKILGENHRDLAFPLNNLAQVLMDRGEYADAEQLFREALAIYTKNTGEKNPEAATITLNIGFALYNQNNFGGAESLYRKALATMREIMGEENGLTAKCNLRLAQTLYAKGERVTSESILTHTLEVQRKIFPQGHADIALTLLLLARSTTDKGEPKKAEDLVREALEIRRNKLSPGSHLIAIAESELGETLTAQKRYEEAEALLLKSYEAIKFSLTEKSRDTQEAQHRLYKLYTTWGKPEKAAQYR
jgi:eukaryotic-like serine/threonine-protein kinase